MANPTNVLSNGIEITGSIRFTNDMIIDGKINGEIMSDKGRVTISGQFQREVPSRVGGAVVRFEPGARTAWHVHPLGQTLIVTEGVGWTQIEGGPKLEFHAGDILWCPADHKHWHGATPHQAMTHIAIQESVDGSPVTWMEKVTDEQYLAEIDPD